MRPGWWLCIGVGKWNIILLGCGMAFLGVDVIIKGGAGVDNIAEIGGKTTLLACNEEADPDKCDGTGSDTDCGAGTRLCAPKWYLFSIFDSFVSLIKLNLNWEELGLPFIGKQHIKVPSKKKKPRSRFL